MHIPENPTVLFDGFWAMFHEFAVSLITKECTGKKSLSKNHCAETVGISIEYDLPALKLVCFCGEDAVIQIKIDSEHIFGEHIIQICHLNLICQINLIDTVQ